MGGLQMVQSVCNGAFLPLGLWKAVIMVLTKSPWLADLMMAVPMAISMGLMISPWAGPDMHRCCAPFTIQMYEWQQIPGQ